jgi:hypothetical protein
MKCLIFPQEIFIAHPERTVIAKTMLQLRHPFWRPLFATVRPRPSPFPFAPWILDEKKALAVDFYGSHDGIGVSFFDAFAVAPSAEKASSTAEEKLVIYFEEFFLPEIFLVQNISGEEFCCDTASEVFNAFPTPLSALMKLLD